MHVIPLCAAVCYSWYPRTPTAPGILRLPRGSLSSTSLNLPGDGDYVSKSTARPLDEHLRFAKGSGERKARLHAELERVGVDVAELVEAIEFRGSAALRMYNSFVLPKSESALAQAELPSRAANIANNIAFMMRENRANKAEWLRNHDAALGEAGQLPTHPLILVLDNVRSAANVGNVIRCAEAARVQHVYACGMTPTPPNAQLLKTAVGSAEYVSCRYYPNTMQAIEELKLSGYTIWGVETTSESTIYCDQAYPQPLALVFGNEIIGIDTAVLRMCDSLICVPTYGIKNSLNVATCASILIWEAVRHMRISQRH
uniref:tRNA/rRNA methyltransferase SpoU type domain-containing protein n=1 Tax=Chrysotila carterae TaxID=13221 RepID=A0A7S4FC99_CHRCT